MLIIISLFVASLFFPPMWFALGIYIIYLVLTKKKRRDQIIMNEIHKLIATEEESVCINSLYFEAAKSFAAENGAHMSPFKNDPDDDTLSIDLEIDNVEYSVCFQRWMRSGTMISIQTAEQVRQSIRESLGDSFADMLEK